MNRPNSNLKASKAYRSVRCVLLLLPLFLFFINFIFITNSRADSDIPPISRLAAGEWYEWIVNYAYHDLDDLRIVNRTCNHLLRLPPAQKDDEESRRMFRLISQIEAFTSPHESPGEQLTLVDFETSDDPAIRLLRDEAGLSPPEGSAIMRIYQIKADMPAPVQLLFTGNAAGVTLLSRYVAVWAENRSEEELNDIISHELVHAFVLSKLGTQSHLLPQWFHEGSALYLSGGKVQYISYMEYGRTRLSWSPKDYNEWRRVFEFLDAKYGQDAVLEFIRIAVQDRSAETALQKVTEIPDYETLQQLSEEHWRRGQMIKGVLILLPIALVLMLLWVRKWWIQRVQHEDVFVYEEEDY